MNINTAITTERLFLERLAESNFAFIFELLNTGGWIKYIGNRNINSAEDAGAYIQKINDNPNIIYWTAKLKGTETAIGLVTLIQRSYLEHKDIGFAFLPRYSKNGYAAEATKAVLFFAVSENLISDILAETLPGNIDSIKLIEKIGLRFEKEIVIENDTLHIYKASADQILINCK